MAGKAKLAQQAIKYGPVIYTAVQKYGPQVLETLSKQREPAQRLVEQGALNLRDNPRKRALQHADSVVEGSLQQVFHAGQAYWMVFSRNEPVGVHPHTNVPYDTLLLNADPGKRVRPAELRRTITLPRRTKG